MLNVTQLVLAMASPDASRQVSKFPERAWVLLLSWILRARVKVMDGILEFSIISLHSLDRARRANLSVSAGITSENLNAGLV